MHNLGGTIRACSPQETLNKITPLFDFFGITRVADITGLDTIGIPVYVCIRPNAKLLSTAQGKSTIPMLAKISAIMESVEVWHAEHIQKKPVIASYAQIAKYHRVPALSTLLDSTINYPDSDNMSVSWIETTNIITNEPIYMPYANYCLDSTIDVLDKGLFISNSNGLASGNTYEEALCHALYELIERDCTEHFFKNKWHQSESHCIDIGSIDSALNKKLIFAIRKSGADITIFDMTHHLKIPTFYAYIHDKNDVRNLGVFSGYGTHLSKEIALSRAITEAVQSRLTYISGSRDDMLPSLYERRKQYSACELLIGKKQYTECIVHELPRTFKGCIDFLLTQLKKNNVTEIAVYNHTRSDINIPVLHAISPQLKHDWRQHRMTT